MSQSTRIAILKSHLGAGGGLEKYTQRLAAGFAKRGCEVHVLTSRYRDGEQDGYQVHNLTGRSRLSWRGVELYNAACTRWLEQESMDIVFGLDRNPKQTHYRAGNGVHATYLEQRALTDSLFKRLSFKINPLHRTILQLERQAFEDPALQLLFCNSQMVKDDILRRFEVPQDRVQVIHNGVEWDEMHADFSCWQERRPELYKQLGSDPSSFQLLFVGSGYERKGLRFLLQGLALLKDQDWQLSVVGKDKQQSVFEALAKQLGVAHKVSFFGQRRDVRSFYQMADALVLPSTYDPFANVTLEALAMGLYTVTSRYNGAAEILPPEHGSIIPDLTDPQAMQAALQQTLQHPKSLASASAAREAVHSYDFSCQLESMIDATLNGVCLV